MNPELINAFTDFLRLLHDTLGPSGMLGVPAILLALVGFVMWRRSRQTNALVQEKERTIQRLANDNRELRIIIAVQVWKWDDERVERYIARNLHPDGPASRRALEGDDQPHRGVHGSNKRRRRGKR